MPGGRTILPPVKNMKITQYEDVATAAASSGEIYIIASDGVVIDPESSKFALNEDPENERFMKLPSIPEVNKVKTEDEKAAESSAAPKWNPAQAQQSASSTKAEEPVTVEEKDEFALEDDEYESSLYHVTKEKRRFLYTSLVVVFGLIALAIIYAAVKSAYEVPPS